MPSSPCLHPLLGVLEVQRLLVIPRAPGHHPVLRVRSDPYLPEHTNTVTHTLVIHWSFISIFTCGGVSYWLSLLSHWSRPTDGSRSTRLTNGTCQSRGAPFTCGPLGRNTYICDKYICNVLIYFRIHITEHEKSLHKS